MPLRLVLCPLDAEVSAYRELSSVESRPVNAILRFSDGRINSKHAVQYETISHYLVHLKY